MAKSKKNQYTVPTVEPSEKTMIHLFPSFARAYEIALLGGFTITVAHNPEYTTAPQDLPLVQNFFQGVEYLPKGGALLVELKQPDLTGKAWHNDTMADIVNRVAKAKDNAKPKDFNCRACDILLTRATQHYQLSIQQVANVKQVAAIIAQLHGKETILAEHIAEACQMVCCNPDTIIYTENSTISFGKHISIGLCEKSTSDIENAIDYLKSLLIF